MALDGMMLSLIRREIAEKSINSRIEKITEPSKDEIVLFMRGSNGNHKIIISARADTARVHITKESPENPLQPPMLCMLLRKLIGNARLIDIRQNGFERILNFDFATVNELGDDVVYTLVCEIMGRYSNIILVNQEGKIVDSLKRVGLDKSSVRQILPGLKYECPPAQEKIPLCGNEDEIVAKVFSYERDIPLYKALGEILEGVSPILSREISHRALRGCDGIISLLTDTDKVNLKEELTKIDEMMEEFSVTPTVVFDEEGNLKDFSFLPITQYEGKVKTQSFEKFGELMDFFFAQRDLNERMKQKMADFSRTVIGKIERIEKKLCLQKNDLLETENKEEFKIKGDLLSSYLYMLKKGMGEIEVDNFYDENRKIKIPLDPLLTPVGNVQKYYKDYRRADTKKKELTRLIKEGEEELSYLYSVYDSMQRSKEEKELSAIRQELSELGYLRRIGKKKEKPVTLPPLKYISSDGFVIFSGRNNVGNDKLTLKTAAKQDLWFHTQKIPGSHTVIISDGREISDRAVFEAATIAAVNSSASSGAKIPVDYTIIKNVKKPSGAKPGMVIYDNYKTMVVIPDKSLCDKLLQR